MTNKTHKVGDDPLEEVAKALAALPGMTKRTGLRLARHMMLHREKVLGPLRRALEKADQDVSNCRRCGNVWWTDPCGICAGVKRDHGLVCVVETVEDLHRIEGSGSYQGLYQVLGRKLSADDLTSLEQLPLERLDRACANPVVQEVILALAETPEAQTIGALIAQRITRPGLHVSSLAKGVPVGADIDKLDEATLAVALRRRYSLAA